MKNRTFSKEFKIDSASLVIDKNYSILEASKAVDVSESAMRKWVKQLTDERNGVTPSKGAALTPEHEQIQLLQAKIRRIERENDILKKATALLISDVNKSL